MNLEEYTLVVRRDITHPEHTKVRFEEGSLILVFDTLKQEDGLASIEKVTVKPSEDNYYLMSYIAHFDRAFETFLSEKEPEGYPSFIESWRKEIKRKKEEGRVQEVHQKQIYDELVNLREDSLSDKEVERGIYFFWRRFEEKSLRFKASH